MRFNADEAELVDVATFNELDYTEERIMEINQRLAYYVEKYKVCELDDNDYLEIEELKAELAELEAWNGKQDDVA
jgi:hypothetical protein